MVLNLTQLVRTTNASLSVNDDFIFIGFSQNTAVLIKNMGYCFGAFLEYAYMTKMY